MARALWWSAVLVTVTEGAATQPQWEMTVSRQGVRYSVQAAAAASPLIPLSKRQPSSDPVKPMLYLSLP
jgi:hypothetical protein